MRNPATVAYRFNPVDRSVDFSGEPDFDIRLLKGIFHLPTGQLLYFPGLPALGYARLDGPVFTLRVNTAPYAAADPLLCVLDDGLNGAATAARQDDAKALLQSILRVLGTQRAETLWTDNGGTYYLRLDNGAGSITWTDIGGKPSRPPGAGARPESDGGTVVSRSTYRALEAGTGFGAGDVLDHLVVTDNAAGALVAGFWLNVTAGTRIDPPAAAAITPLAPLPDGAATAELQTTANAALLAAAAALGRPADPDPGADTAPGSILAKLTRLLIAASGLEALLAALRDRLPASLASGRLAVDGSGATQPVAGVGAVGTAPATPPLQVAALDPAGHKQAILVNGDGALLVATPVPAGIVTGQVRIVTTGTPVQLPSAALRNGLVVKAHMANAPQNPAAGYSAAVGPAGVTTQYDGAGNGYPLAPGEAGSFACANAQAVWVNGTAGDIFAYEGN
ncbi:hypothetical protein [Methylobacterium sp. D54C]